MKKILLIAFFFALPLVSSAQSFTRTLYIGLSGPDVAELQQKLRDLGFYAYPSVTGWYGPVTAQAVSRFQQAYAADILVPNGLAAPTGTFGPATRAKLASLSGSQPQAASAVPASGGGSAASSDPGCPAGFSYSFLTGQPCARISVPSSASSRVTQSTAPSRASRGGGSRASSRNGSAAGNAANPSNQGSPSSPSGSNLNSSGNSPSGNSSSNNSSNGNSSNSNGSSGTTCASVSQWGIAWTFDRAYPCGRFANGDWWVVGPVVITRITPDFTGLLHGWEVNPQNIVNQGFDYRVAQYTPSLVPTLPYTAQPNQSIIKSVSDDISAKDCRPCLKTAAVLTVLGSIPINNGADVFRPGYFGTEKKLYSVSSLRTDKLLSLSASGINSPSLSTIQNNFNKVWLEHKTSPSGRLMRPLDNVPWYDASGDVLISEGFLRLQLSGTVTQKLPALIAYIQSGIDHFSILKNGGNWYSEHGRKLLIAATGYYLDDAEIKNAVTTAPFGTFEEDDVLSFSAKANNGAGMVLYGDKSTEITYWSHIVTGANSKTLSDPYGYVDGGWPPGEAYQYCCTSMPFKYIALALHLVPGVRQIYNNDLIISYADRWISTGTWAQPDVCAPPDPRDIAAKKMNYYKITYGPDPTRPGECIRDTDPSDGIGRNPANHGLNKHGGLYGSSFGNSMWNAYRTHVSPPTNNNSQTQNQPPAVTISASPTTVKSGATAMLTWSALHATSCTASNGWSGSKSLAGSYVTLPLTSNTIYTLTCTGVGGSSSQSVTVLVQPSLPTANAPVLSFTFDQLTIVESSIQDQSGNDTTGTLINEPTLEGGRVAEALKFNGTNQKVISTTLSRSLKAADDPSFTISIWASPEDFTVGRALFGFGDHPSLRYLNSGALRFCQNSSTCTNIKPVGVLNTWQHVVLTYDQSAYKIYVNGELVGTATNILTDLSNLGSNYTFYIGSGGPNNYHFSGLIDDVRIYNRALSASEVQALYNQ